MKKAKRTNPAEQEPMGIVISRGSTLEYVPKVLAYVWAPAPEASDEAHPGTAA